MRPTLSVLIVAWNSREELARTLPALLPELGEGDELIVVDNDSSDGTAAAVLELAPAARVVSPGRNLGFAAGVNAGAAEAEGELLVILNPDAAPRPGWGEAIRRPWREGRGWAAWQALVADVSGTKINSAGNPIHFTGIVWAGGHGRPDRRGAERRRGDGPLRGLPGDPAADLAPARRFPGALLPLPRGRRPLAAAAAARRHARDRAGRGRRPRLRVRRPRAQVALARAQPPGLPDPRLPDAAAAAAGARPAADRAGPAPRLRRGGWGAEKLAADRESVRWLPRLLRERRQIQATRTVTAAEFASWLTPDLDSPFIASAARSLPARLLLRTYWRAVRMLLR